MQANGTSQQWLSREEAAKILGISPWTFGNERYHWLRKKNGVRKGNRGTPPVLYFQPDIEKCKAERIPKGWLTRDQAADMLGIVYTTLSNPRYRSIKRKRGLYEQASVEALMKGYEAVEQEGEWISRAEASKILGVSPGTLSATNYTAFLKRKHAPRVEGQMGHPETLYEKSSVLALQKMWNEWLTAETAASILGVSASDVRHDPKIFRRLRRKTDTETDGMPTVYARVSVELLARNARFKSRAKSKTALVKVKPTENQKKIEQANAIIHGMKHNRSADELVQKFMADLKALVPGVVGVEVRVHRVEEYKDEWHG